MRKLFKLFLKTNSESFNIALYINKKHFQKTIGIRWVIRPTRQ